MQLSQGQIKRLGKHLRERDSESFPDAVAAYVDYSLSYMPLLQAVTDALWDAITSDPEIAARDVRIGARLKQVRSVSAKIRRLGSGLNGMQDLAGCRVVVPDLWDQAVVTALAQKTFLIKSAYDYRKHDNNGYRGRHLVLRGVAPTALSTVAWPPRTLIELQVRTELQDLWANVSELHGKYSATEHHKAQLIELSDTLWRLDQVRLALRISSEERQLLKEIDHYGSPVQEVVKAWKRGVGDLFYVPWDQAIERRRRIVSTLDLVPLDNALELHSMGLNAADAFDSDKPKSPMYELLKDVRLAVEFVGHMRKPLGVVIPRGLEPRPTVRRRAQYLLNKASSILTECDAARDLYSMEPLWIDRLPGVTAAARKEVILAARGEDVPLAAAVTQDLALSWLGLCRTSALATALVSPLASGAQRLEWLAVNRLWDWSNAYWHGSKEELDEWDDTAAALRAAVRDHVKINDGEIEPASGNSLVSRWNGVLGHLIGLRGLKHAFRHRSEEVEYRALRSWIEHRDQVRGNREMGPHDLLRELGTQVDVDDHILRQALKSELGDERLKVWGLHPKAMNFNRFLKSGGRLVEKKRGSSQDRQFCVVLRGEAELTGKIVGIYRDQDDAGADLQLRTASLLKSRSTGEMTLEGEAIVMYSEPKLDHIETHLRYFMDAREMVERIMEDLEVRDDAGTTNGIASSRD